MTKGRDDAETTYTLRAERGLCAMVFTGERSYMVELPSVGRVSVGRSPESDLHIASEGVSRAHARIDVAAGRAELEDLGSRNGTFVNGERVEGKRAVSHGDEICVGDARLVLYRRSASQLGGPAMLLHGAFEQRLRVEAGRSVGFGRPLALVLVHLPRGFGAKGLVEALLSATRPVDFCGIYDDRTVEIALPEQGEAEAARLVEALGRAVEPLSPGVVFGAASLSGRGGSAEELLEKAIAALRRAVGGKREASPSGVLVRDPVMLRIHEQVRRIAKSTIGVLVTGETGAGKEVIARAIHEASGRKGLLVSVNAAAFPEHLLESELFGHEKGAFTGATSAKPGLFEAASGGTLFLDEIGELALAVQAKLLRVLEDRKVRRVGSTVDRRIDARVVAASNCDLERRVAEGRFRQDLLYRLNACTILVPPLRDRPSEILPLAEFFLERAAREQGRPALALHELTRARLLGHAWPGNVRELRNVMDRAAALCHEGGLVLPEHLPEHLGRAQPLELRPAPLPEATPPSRPASEVPTFTDPTRPSTDVRSALEAVEREKILEALRRTNGNQTRAAELLGIPRKTLAYRLDRLGLGAKRPSR